MILYGSHAGGHIQSGHGFLSPVSLACRSPASGTDSMVFTFQCYHPAKHTFGQSVRWHVLPYGSQVAVVGSRDSSALDVSQYSFTGLKSGFVFYFLGNVLCAFTSDCGILLLPLRWSRVFLSSGGWWWRRRYGECRKEFGNGRIMSPPPAIPEWRAIHPALWPMTSMTMTRAGGHWQWNAGGQWRRWLSLRPNRNQRNVGSPPRHCRWFWECLPHLLPASASFCSCFLRTVSDAIRCSPGPRSRDGWSMMVCFLRYGTAFSLNGFSREVPRRWFLPGSEVCQWAFVQRNNVIVQQSPKPLWIP